MCRICEASGGGGGGSDGGSKSTAAGITYNLKQIIIQFTLEMYCVMPLKTIHNIFLYSVNGRLSTVEDEIGR